MLRGNPPPQHPFSFYRFSFTFQKKSENFGGGRVERPLKYALIIIILFEFYYLGVCTFMAIGNTSLMLLSIN